MIVADRACQLPLPVVVPPERYELCFAPGVLRMYGLMKPVHTNLHRSVTVQRVDFQRPWYKCPLHLATDVLLDGCKERILADREACLVVIKLQVIGDHGAQRFQIAAVVGLTEFRIQRLYLLEELSGGRTGLSTRRAKENGRDQYGPIKRVQRLHESPLRIPIGKVHKILLTDIS